MRLTALTPPLVTLGGLLFACGANVGQTPDGVGCGGYPDTSASVVVDAGGAVDTPPPVDPVLPTYTLPTFDVGSVDFSYCAVDEAAIDALMVALGRDGQIGQHLMIGVNGSGAAINATAAEAIAAFKRSVTFLIAYKVTHPHDCLLQPHRAAAERDGVRQLQGVPVAGR